MLTIADLRTHPLFEQMKAAVEKAGSDSVDTFGGTFHGGYHVQQHPEEFAALVCLLLKRCKPIGIYGEIGVAAGGTTRLIAESVGFERAVLIDDAQHPKHKHFIENVHEMKFPYFFIQGDSHGEYVRDTLANHLSAGAKFDVVFIDGDHSYEGVVKDIELVKPYCRPTTMLVFHDTRACPGVEKAFADLKHPLAEFVSEDKHLGIGVALAGE